LGGTLASAVWVVNSLGTTPLLVLAGLSLLFGILFVLPVGGADVPIVISLLNAFTGLTVAAGGYVLDATLLIIAGTLVGFRNYFDSFDGRSDGSIIIWHALWGIYR